MSIEIGEKAPNVEFPESATGESFKLSDLKGKNVLLAFYPKAYTPGCTKQMCGYTEDFNLLEQKKVQVIAISKDKQKSADGFKAKYDMPFYVIGDSAKEIIRTFEVHLKLGVSAQRSVFLIDKQGIIRYINMKYSVTKSKDELYEEIDKLE